MITSKELKDSGWKHIGTASNGGSKLFHKGNFVLNSNADNFTMSEDEKSVVKLELLLTDADSIFYTVHEGPISSLNELSEIIKKA